MEELVKKVGGILDTYFRDCVGNRVNQWSFRTLKTVLLGEIANHKFDENKKEPDLCRPVFKKVVKEDKKAKGEN